MDAGVKVAIISAAAAVISASFGIIVVAVTHFLNVRQKRMDELRQRKLEHYKELLSAISNTAIHGLNEETGARYSSAINTIALTAPQSVIKALLEYHDEIKVTNPNRSIQRHNQLLTKLVLEIRRSLELPFQDDPETFEYRLAGGPKSRVLENQSQANTPDRSEP